MTFDAVHLIYFSPTHTSHTVGKAIAKGTGISQIIETDLTYCAPDNPVVVERCLCVVAVPVYGGRVAETAMQRLEWISGKESPVVPVVVYGNRDYEDALLELTDWTIEHGFVPVAGAAFVGEHSYSRPDRPVAANRPDADDLQVATLLGIEVMKCVAEVAEPNRLPGLKVKGNRPYKVKGNKTPQAPVVNEELCTQCGLCAGICPVGAIAVGEESVSDAESCIKCCACVKGCPQNARIFDTPFTDFLFKNFSARREPELFFQAL